MLLCDGLFASTYKLINKYMQQELLVLYSKPCIKNDKSTFQKQFNTNLRMHTYADACTLNGQNLNLQEKLKKAHSLLD